MDTALKYAATTGRIDAAPPLAARRARGYEHEAAALERIDAAGQRPTAAQGARPSTAGDR